MARVFADNAESELDSGIIAGATSSTLDDGSDFPATGDFTIRFEDPADPDTFELVTATARAGAVLTHGATVGAWAAGTKVFQVVAVTDLQAFVQRTETDPLTQYHNNARGDARYQALADVVRFFSASELQIVAGAPTRTVGGSAAVWVMWLLDAAVVEQIGASFHVPSDWATVNIDLYWCSPGSGASGDASFTVLLDSEPNGDSLASGANSGVVTITAAAQNVLKVSRIWSGAAVTPGNLTQLRVARQATNVADTLNNDAGVLGVKVSKAS